MVFPSFEGFLSVKAAVAFSSPVSALTAVAEKPSVVAGSMDSSLFPIVVLLSSLADSVETFAALGVPVLAAALDSTFFSAVVTSRHVANSEGTSSAAEWVMCSVTEAVAFLVTVIPFSLPESVGTVAESVARERRVLVDCLFSAVVVPLAAAEFRNFELVSFSATLIVRSLFVA